MSGSERLYTPEMLGAAVELANYPLLETLTYRGEARSVSCGSSLHIGFTLDDRRAIIATGLRARACAVGQASAAIFVRHAKGLTLEDIACAQGNILNWLGQKTDEGTADISQPNWPDFSIIAAARDFPGRHGAIILPWRAAIAALSKTDEPS